MPPATDPRQKLLDRLPPKVRKALKNGDDVALIEALRQLTDEQRQNVEEVIRELSALATGVAAEAGADARDAGLTSVLAPAGFVSAPPSLFQVRDGQKLVPPREWLDATHRAAAAVDARSVVYPVWYATNRKPVKAGSPGRGFTAERAAGGEVSYGVARVFVPDTHQPGSLGSAWYKRWLWTWQDDRLVLRKIEGREEAEFYTQLKAQLAQMAADGGEKDILLFVHGYNVDFASAVVRAAQLGYDLALPGLTACFSWPSQGTYRGYTVDEAACEPSVFALVKFLRGLRASVGPGRLHVLAHSMGNRVALRALERVALEDRAERAETPPPPLGHLLLAAPDIDRDLFRLLIPDCLRVRQAGRRATMYVSTADRAVSISRWFHGAPRAGFHPPVTLFPGVDTVDVTRADLSFVGHSAYGEARPVIRDMTRILHHGEKPDDPGRKLGPLGGGTYWELG